MIHPLHHRHFYSCPRQDQFPLSWCDDGILAPARRLSLSGPDLELVVAILTSLPAESVLVQSAVTTITSGSQQAVSQQIVAPQIIRDSVE